MPNWHHSKREHQCLPDDRMFACRFIPPDCMCETYPRATTSIEGEALSTNALVFDCTAPLGRQRGKYVRRLQSIAIMKDLTAMQMRSSISEPDAPLADGWKNLPQFHNARSPTACNRSRLPCPTQTPTNSGMASHSD